MPITNLIPQPMEFFSPDSYQDYSKIIITSDSDVDYTVLDSYGGLLANNYCISARIDMEATGKLASYSVRLSNNDGSFLDLFDGGETVVFYSDSTDATTEIFRGKIDDIKYEFSTSDGFTVEITGRQYPELNDKTIIGLEAASLADVAIAGILFEFFDNITLKYWNGTTWVTATYDQDHDTVDWSGASTGFPTDTINMTYEHRKGWNVITEICRIVGLDCYLVYDSGWELRIFNEQAVTNSQCSIAYGVNLLNVSDYGVENSETYNRIYLYGKTRGDNIIMFKSKNNSTSQNNLWIKDKIIDDDTADTMDKLDAIVDYQLDLNSTIPSSGSFSAVGLKSIKPGELINISVPYCGVNGTFVAKKVSHSIGNYIKTTVEVSKSKNSLVDLFIPQTNYDGFLSGFNNPNGMEGSYSVSFDTDYSHATLTNCSIVGDSVQMNQNYTTASFIVNNYTTTEDVAQCELRKYDNYSTSLDTYQVSNDGGTTWHTYDIGSNSIHNFSTVGKSLSFKVTMNRVSASDPSPAYKALVMLYK